VRCSVSREALDDHFGTDRLDKNARVVTFLENRATFEKMLRTKFLAWPIEEYGTVLIKTGDVEALRDGLPALR
jgi:hypothetical protein